MNRHSVRLGLLLFALLLFVGGWGYRQIERGTQHRLQKESHQTLEEIRETRSLEKLWHPRGLSRKIEELKALLPSDKIKQFRLKSHRLELSLTPLPGRLLNRFLGRLLSLPLQIHSLRIRREGALYTMECRCKW